VNQGDEKPSESVIPGAFDNNQSDFELQDYMVNGVDVGELFLTMQQTSLCLLDDFIKIFLYDIRFKFSNLLFKVLIFDYCEASANSDICFKNTNRFVNQIWDMNFNLLILPEDIFIMLQEKYSLPVKLLTRKEIELCRDLDQELKRKTSIQAGATGDELLDRIVRSYMNMYYKSIFGTVFCHVYKTL